MDAAFRAHLMDLLEQLAGEQVPTGLGGHRRSGPRCIDVHIRRLRAKLGDDLPVVRTVHGVGYRLDGGCPVTVARLAGADDPIGSDIGDSRVTWGFD